MFPLQWASPRSHCAGSLQRSGRGGDPAPQLGHFSPGRRTKVVELPGPGEQGRLMCEGGESLFWSMLTLKTSERL